LQVRGQSRERELREDRRRARAERDSRGSGGHLADRGESGFGSEFGDAIEQVRLTRSEAPPQRKKSTVDFAGLASVGVANAQAVDAYTPGANRNDDSAMVEAVMNSRRLMGGRNK
jgi:hypothetical protein